MIVILLLGFALLALWQIPGLVKKNWRKELVCFSLLWFTGLVLSLMIALGVRIPPLSTLIGQWISMLGIQWG